MCRWGCLENASTFMCKWCGTRYCRECLRGDFIGLKKDPGTCKVCNQPRCQGKKVEVYPPREPSPDRGKKGKKGASKSGKGGKKSKKSGSKKSKSAGKKTGGKKKGGKKKK